MKNNTLCKNKVPAEDFSHFLARFTKSLATVFDASKVALRHHVPTPECLSFLCNGLVSQLNQALVTLKKLPTTTFSKPDFDQLFGTNWDGHPFNHKALFWWREPLEPDATRMIGYVCSSHYAKEKNQQRIFTFLRALQNATITPMPLPEYALHNDLEIECELPIEENKRLDIVVQCKKSKKVIALIEAKFDAALNNPLDMYREYRNKNGRKGLLYLLGCTDGRGSKDIKYGWGFVHWYDFLREWERLLLTNHDIDEDFSRLRASLWKKLAR